MQKVLQVSPLSDEAYSHKETQKLHSAAFYDAAQHPVESIEV